MGTRSSASTLKALGPLDDEVYAGKRAFSSGPSAQREAALALHRPLQASHPSNEEVARPLSPPASKVGRVYTTRISPRFNELGVRCTPVCPLQCSRNDSTFCRYMQIRFRMPYVRPRRPHWACKSDAPEPLLKVGEPESLPQAVRARRPATPGPTCRAWRFPFSLDRIFPSVGPRGPSCRRKPATRGTEIPMFPAARRLWRSPNW